MNDKRGAESVFAARSSAKVLQRMLSAAAVLFVLCLVFAAPVGAESTVNTWDDLKTALANGGEVVLGNNIVSVDLDTAGSLSVNDTIPTILDLAGYTISATYSTSSSKNLILIPSYGSLTIKDSGNDGAIILLYDSTDVIDPFSTAIDLIKAEAGSHLDIQGGELNISSVDSNHGLYAIGLYSNGGAVSDFKMSGGKVESSYIGLRVALIGNTETCNVLVTGGEFYTTKNSLWVHQFNDQDNSEQAAHPYNLTITGGKFTSEIRAAIGYWTMCNDLANAGVEYITTISGGEFNANPSAGYPGIIGYSNTHDWNDIPNDNDKHKLYITGGTFNLIGDSTENRSVFDYSAKSHKGPQVYVSGGTFADPKILSYLEPGTEITVTLAENVVVEDTITIPAGTDVTLDLNGHTISQVKACTASYSMIENKGNLTIEDTAGGGKISFTDTGAGDPNFGWGSYTIRNEGTLVVGDETSSDLTIEMLRTQSTNHCSHVIYQYSGSTTINNGNITHPTYHALRLWSGDMIINGGNVTGTRAIWIQLPGSDTSKAPVVNVTVNGGTLTGSKIDSSDNKLAIYSYSYGNSMKNVNITITGGTFNGDVALTGGKNKNAPVETLTVTGGEFNGYWGCVYSYAENDVAKETMSITGGTFTTVDNDEYADLCEDLSVYLADGYALTGSDDEGYTVCLEAEITGPATVTEDVAAVFKANSSILSLDNAKFVWSVDGTVVGGFTGNSLEYTFADPTGADSSAVISVVAELENGQKAVGSFDVTVEAAKVIPKEEEKKPAQFETDKKPDNFDAVNFHQADINTNAVTLAVVDMKASTEEEHKQKVEEHKEAIPAAKEVVASYSISGAPADMAYMAEIKITVKLDSPLDEGEKLQAYRFNDAKQIVAMPLKTEYYPDRSDDEDCTYVVTIYTPGFSDFTVVTEEEVVPNFKLTVDQSELNIDETSTPYIFAGNTLTLPVIFTTEDVDTAPKTYEFNAQVYNVTNENTPVSGVSYTYTQSISGEYVMKGENSVQFAISDFTPVEKTGLFQLVISDDEGDEVNSLNAGSEYKVVISGTAYYSEKAEIAGQGAQDYALDFTVTQEFAVKSWLVSVDNNIYNNTGLGITTPWNFTNPVVYEYIVYAGDYAGEDWPTVMRIDGVVNYLNQSASEERKAAVSPLAFKESKVDVKQSYQDLSNNVWISSSDVSVNKNTDKKIAVTVNEENTPAYLKLTFTGYKMGDVIGNNDAVNLADVDVLLQEITDGLQGYYVADDRKVYADVWIDGQINSNDVLPIFQHYLGYDTNNIEELTAATGTA